MSGNQHGTNTDNRYDAIVIGSGMGGLATASILAQVGRKRVLVLESHFKLGGFLHSFRRHGYVWDPGVHYIGDMADGSITRQCMDLVTGGRVAWNKLEDRFERFVFPDHTFEVPSDPAHYQERLKERFPAEAENLESYFRDIKSIQGWSHRWFYSKQFPEPVASVVSAGRKLATANTRDYLETRFADPVLKAILTAQWPDYGTPPDRSALGVHGIVVSDFQNGGYYPAGGSQAIVSAAASIVLAHGGACLVKHPVRKILIRNNRAIGVSVEHRGERKEFFAPIIVSDAGVATTFADLVEPRYGLAEKARLADLERGPSAAILFLGLNEDPRNKGFENCNYWIYDSLDFSSENPSGQFPPEIGGAYLSFGSLRNPGQRPHTAQVVTFSEETEWDDFGETTNWKKRGERYEQAKARYAEELLDFVDKRLPGLRPMVAYQELATPLTVKSFTNHSAGQVYGRACTPARLRGHSWSIATSIKRLYLTGTDLVVPGVNSALMIGVMTAGKVLGPLGTPRVMHQAFSAKYGSKAAA